MQKIIDGFYQFFLSADKTGALEYIDKWAKDKSYAAALEKIVEPALRKFGEKWANADDVNLAQGYIAAKIAEAILVKISDERKTNNITPIINGIAVLGNIEDDYHALGRKMVKNFLLSSGWTVYDLGNDVLAREFVDKAVEVNATIIGASAMMYSNSKNMIKIREELDARNLSDRIKFAVGGAIFNLRPELVKEVGADGTAKNAIEAVRLFEELSLQIGDEK